MNLYEFEAKILLNFFNLLTPKSILIKKFFFLKKKIYKIQVHTGYRKKNNGILFFDSKSECFLFQKKWFNNFLLKKKIEFILIENKINFKKEFFISFFLSNDYLIFIISSKGGIDIEMKKKIEFFKIKIEKMFFVFSIINYLINCKFEMNFIIELVKTISILFKIIFIKKILLLEINPLVFYNKNIYILDCKIILELKSIKNFSERISSFLNINYIYLNGNISCIVNGAGLSLKTLDLLSYKEGKSLNFIDLSGSIKDLDLNNLFKFFLMQKKIKVLFVNLFGGIVSCKKISYALLNLMYYNFNFKIILKFDGIDSKFSKKILLSYKNLLINNNISNCINKCIILSNV